MTAPCSPAAAAPDAALLAVIVRCAQEQGTDCHAVGGYVRDRLLGRVAPDLDLVVPGDPVPLARRLARELGGPCVVLDAEHGIARVLGPGGVTVDLARAQAPTLVEDLRSRDLTINAMALPLVVDGVACEAPALVDPTGGQADLAAGVIRAIAAENLVADPVRLLRVFRFAAQLDFAIAPLTLDWLEMFRRRLLEAPGERVHVELFKILALPRAQRWVERLFGVGYLDVLFPELPMLRRVPPAPGSGLDGVARALEHHRAVAELLRGLEVLLPELAVPLGVHLGLELGQGVRRRELLQLAALLHEVGEPFGMAFDADGTRTFAPHAAESGRRLEAIARRLKLSAPARTLLGTVGRLQHEPLTLDVSDPVATHHFFRAAGAASPEVLLLARAVDPEAAERVDALLAAYHRPGREPVRLLDGQEVMAELGLAPGPGVGQWLEELLAAQLRGQVTTRGEAIAWLRRRHEERG